MPPARPGPPHATRPRRPGACRRALKTGAAGPRPRGDRHHNAPPAWHPLGGTRGSSALAAALQGPSFPRSLWRCLQGLAPSSAAVPSCSTAVAVASRQGRPGGCSRHPPSPCRHLSTLSLSPRHPSFPLLPCPSAPPSLFLLFHSLSLPQPLPGRVAWHGRGGTLPPLCPPGHH